MKVGDYVRTNKGTIDKLTDKNIMTYEVAIMGFGEKPIKSSSNIIDLIEVGDYVNGYMVLDVNITEIIGHKSYIKIRDKINSHIRKEDIKSIVTKEQFSSMEYKL